MSRTNLIPVGPINQVVEKYRECSYTEIAARLGWEKAGGRRKGDGDVTRLKRALGLSPVFYGRKKKKADGTAYTPICHKNIDADLASRILEAAGIDPQEAGV